MTIAEIPNITIASNATGQPDEITINLKCQPETEMKPTITIIYCPKCGWLLRAAYMAQELLTTFTDDVHGVLLHPAEVSGRFSIAINEEIVFDRKEQGRFPEIKELKQLVRDKAAPGKNLGHSDNR